MSAVGPRATTPLRAPLWRLALVPLGLFLVAVLVRLVVVAWIPFPPTEGSLYYLDVARNLAEGRGLTTDVLWSYATTPWELPRPAFDLWLPVASIVAALPMLLAGTTAQAGQIGGVLLGSLLAPLAWAVTRQAATIDGLGDRRRAAAAIAAGLLAAILGPWLVTTAGPDSTIPFAVLGTLDALLIARLLRPPHDAPRDGSRARLAFVLGLALGLTYLARQEVVWIGLTLVLLAVPMLRRVAVGHRPRATLTLLGPVAVGGLLLVVPWLLRQQRTFSGGGGISQAIDNMFLLRNEQIFSIHDEPTVSAWLAQGLDGIVGAWGRALAAQGVDTIALGAFPVGVVGIAAMIALRRRPSLRTPSALVVLLLSGTITFLATAILFPVATLWGTFAHASGPLLMGLIIASVLGADALMTRISIRRGWDPVNVVVGPGALLALALPMTLIQLTAVAGSARNLQQRITAVGTALEADGGIPALLMSDQPMSVSWLLDRPVMVLPDDPPATLAELARATGVRTILMFQDDRGGYPDALLGPGATCLVSPPVLIGPADDPALLAIIDPSCTP
ncbi:MAG: hypothetical protein KF809_01050 [Chloroflexi bacterium]|nr:hypothetical protein [Chloroflexota bacterium]